ncbi:hypothetical protein [Nostoc sp. MG11]|uniref:hypothetical protein n=1 Tax=Nostoc sp. MG11 TaxID=2721166 RepID=UPI00186632F1|nr:hypothetical protein [Nostoc sp. MG11]
MKFSFVNPQKLAALLLVVPTVTVTLESPSRAENFRGNSLSGTITCTNPTASNTRVNYSLFGDPIAIFLTVVPGSSGQVFYFDNIGTAIRPANTSITNRLLGIAGGTSSRPGSRSQRALLRDVRIVGTRNGFPAIFSVDGNSNAIATCF